MTSQAVARTRLRAGANASSVKKSKSRLLPIFSPDFTLNSQIRLFYSEKWIFLKKLSTLLRWYVPKKKRENCVCSSKIFFFTFEIFHALSSYIERFLLQ